MKRIFAFLVVLALPGLAMAAGEQALDSNGIVVPGVFRPGAVHRAEFHSDTVRMDNGKIATGTRVARVICTTACYFAIQVTATNTNGYYLPANTETFVKVGVRDWFTARMFGGSTGTMFVIEMR
jgi:hypothetical protein